MLKSVRNMLKVNQRYNRLFFLPFSMESNSQSETVSQKTAPTSTAKLPYKTYREYYEDSYRVSSSQTHCITNMRHFS